MLSKRANSIHSTIFKTTDNDTSITNIFKESFKEKDIYKSLDKQTTRSAIKAFNNTSLSVEELHNKFSELDNSVFTYLNTTQKGTATINGLKSNLDTASTSMGIATLGAKGLSSALNILAELAITSAISGIIWLFDELITTLDEQQEKLEKAKTSYNESNTELSNLNNELKTTNERIDVLNTKDNLTFTEKDELKKLKEINDELERKIFLLEKSKQESEKNVADEAQNLYNRYNNNRNFDLIEQIDVYGNSSLLEGVNWENYKDDLSWLIAQYYKQQEVFKKAQDNGWSDIESNAKDNIVLLESYMADASGKYTSLYETISGLGETSITPELETAKYDLNEILNLVAKLLGYEGELKQSSFEDIWNSDGFQKYKEELIGIAQNGEISPELISSNDNYKKLLDETGNSAEETAEHINALVNEIQNSLSSNAASSSSISGTIDKLNAQLKPTFDSLKSAYQDIFTENGFVRENIDLSMFSDIKSTLDNLSELGLAVDYSSFEDFVRVLNDTESTEGNIRNAFNDLATTISQVAISGTEDFETLKSALKDFGVENSEMVAFSNLANNTEALKEAGLDIADASKEQMTAFAEEYVAAENVTQAVNMLTYAKQLSQIENMDTSGEIANLKTLAENAGYTGDVIQYLTELEQIYQEIASGTLTPGNLDRKLKRADELQNLIKDSSSKIEYNPTEFVGKSGTSSASSAGQDAADAYLEAFENELSELDTLKDRGKITEKQYLDALRKLYVKYYNDKEKYLDQYEKYEYQYLSGMKSLYESAFSYIVKQIDKRIDALRKESESQVANLEAQKKAAEEFYQSQIDDIDDQIESIDKEIAAKQDLIDAINDAAEARKREIDLQKAQYDLERMQNQKTNYVYKDGQMIYEADSTGIRDARENVEDAKREVEIAAVEKVIEGLEKQRDILEEQKEALEQALEASNAYWDAQIEQTEQYFDTLITGMEEYKSRWEELSEIEENAKMNLALEELGITEQDILGMSTEAFNNVKQAYMNILADMYNGNDQLLMQLSALSGIQLSDLTGYLDGTVDALDRLNQMDLEETNKSISGISGSFDSIAASAGSAASAIDGGSGGGDVQDNASGENNTPGNGGGGSGKSILNSIQTLSTEGVDNINKVANAFAGSNEDEQSGVSVASAVQQVIDKVGSGQAKSKNPNSNDTKAPTGKSSDSLMSAIQDQTEAALNEESGIPAQKKAWENLNEPLDKANELILSIKNSLEGMDGKEFSVTLSVHGSSIGTVIKGIMGIAEVEGTALLQGDWGAKESRKSLVGELGQELIVRGSRFFTVGNNGAEMFNVQKGDIIFNHEQTEQLLKHGRISSRGTSYADGTTNTFPDYLTPIDQLSDEYSLFRKFNEYLKKSTDIFSSAGSLHRPLEEIADSVSMIETTVNNKNMNAMRTFEINIGDINLEGVQDVNSLSAAIVTRLPNLVIQELHRS